MAVEAKAKVRSLATAVALAAATGALGLVGAVGSAGAEALVPVEGSWSGTTSVGLPVSFRVEAGNVVDAHFGFHWGYCGNFTSDESNTDPIDPESRWSFDSPEGQTIEGAFTAPERVEGSVATVGRMTPGCPATHATFIAIRGKVPPPTPPQYFMVVNTEGGSQLRLPEEVYLGRFISFLLFHMQWSDWGKNVAYGTGNASIRKFKREWTTKARVEMSRPIPDGTRQRLYSLLRFSLQGRLPAHYPRTGWFKFDRDGVVSSSDGRWPGGPGYTGGHHR
jgi:hypothetical protein